VFLPKTCRDTDREEAVRDWAECLRDALADCADPDFVKTASYPTRWTTPSFTTHCDEALGIPALAMETPYAMAGDRLLEIEDYREIGRRLATAISGLAQSARGQTPEDPK
jgi:hypothetical protein